MDKKILRNEMRQLRDSLNKEEKKYRDNILKEKLLNNDNYKKSKVIFTYLGFDSEINTKDYINSFLNDGKIVCIPRTNIKDKYMDAVIIDSLESLVKNKYGILEPSFDLKAIDKKKIDLVIMPGLAFDKYGGRLGYGGGYYDKFLATISKDVVKIALAYDFQIVDKIPMESHDIKANFVIVDKN